MDTLDKIFASLDLVGSVFYRSTLSSPWRLDLAADDVTRFHIVLKGEAYLGVESREEQICLRRGDAILLRGGQAHWIGDSPEHSSSPCRLLCGRLLSEHECTHPLLSSLPACTVMDSREDSELEWIARIGQLMDYEMDQEAAGKKSMIERLCEIFFTLAYRYTLCKNQNDGGFLGALGDKQISQALELIHAAPEKHWNIASLASSVALSRSAFARRFNLLVGVPPNTYLTMWRMNLAMKRIRMGSATISCVASEVGYESEAGFYRAFHREFGMTPSEAREQSRSAEIAEAEAS